MKTKITRFATFGLVVALLLFRDYIKDLQEYNETLYMLVLAGVLVIMFVLARKTFGTPNKPQPEKAKRTEHKGKKSFVQEMLPDFSFAGLDFSNGKSAKTEENKNRSERPERELPSYEADEQEGGEDNDTI